ncbi:hypothetical protein NPX13_g5088 [Xylaria arbuscula]|uniref:Uncharacterized protein n=1 Tax=Xylaria arbuscula TaxID=114810 RepID=A0A9W8TLB6_9PEZI|nr:hypothetical protein NPX13_g5088 [Xylaria arbuscula]
MQTQVEVPLEATLASLVLPAGFLAGAGRARQETGTGTKEPEKGSLEKLLKIFKPALVVSRVIAVDDADADADGLKAKAKKAKMAKIKGKSERWTSIQYIEFDGDRFSLVHSSRVVLVEAVGASRQKERESESSSVETRTSAASTSWILLVD